MTLDFSCKSYYTYKQWNAILVSVRPFHSTGRLVDLVIHGGNEQPMNWATNGIDRRTLLGGAAALAGTLTLNSLVVGPRNASAQDAVPEVVYSAKEYAFDGPVELPGGIVKLTMKNEGMMDHHFMLLQFAEGK